MTYKDHKEWKERFDDKTRTMLGASGSYIGSPHYEMTTSFIGEELSHQLTTIQEMIEGLPTIWRDKKCACVETDKCSECTGEYEIFVSKEDLLAKLKEIKQ